MIAALILESRGSVFECLLDRELCPVDLQVSELPGRDLHLQQCVRQLLFNFLRWFFHRSGVPFRIKDFRSWQSLPLCRHSRHFKLGETVLLAATVNRNVPDPW